MNNKHQRQGGVVGSVSRQQLLWYLLLRVVFITLVIGITVFLEVRGHRLPVDKSLYPLLFVVFVYLLTIVSAVLIGKPGVKKEVSGVGEHRLSHFAALHIFFDIFLVSLLVLFSGSSQSIFTVVYFIPIIASGFLLKKITALLMAAISTLGYGGILFFEYVHQRVDFLINLPVGGASQERLLNLFAVNGISFFFVAGLAFLLAGRLQRTQQELSLTANRFASLNKLYKQIFDDITTGIITIGRNGRISSCNRAALGIIGGEVDVLVGRSIESIMPKLAKKDGWIPGRRQESRLVRVDGEEVPVGYTLSPLGGEAADEHSFVLSLQDLSQIREMEEKVRQTEKMAAVGEMAAGIAHEFRNPLAAISGSAQLLTSRPTEQPGQQRLLAIIVRECERLELAVRNFLLFSRPPRPQKKNFRLKVLLSECLALIQKTPLWGEKHQVELLFDEQLELYADYDQVKQVFINLLSNACQAMPEGGKISCFAKAEQGQSQPGLRITFADQGHGVPEKLLGKVFNPYFTTRQEGTGLGLAIVHQIVRAHGGDIELANRRDAGAAVTIFLPVNGAE